ncbi:WD repeat-containing 55 [Senna tora]|uniref:WD repeat-containing 55 n=1 Tax=Senna tora TaxID=362788 RepID=A0A834WRT4_9FABA|nr:WD repeat-containing 55 [Senna tora]
MLLLCSLKQRLNLVNPTASMRFRSKRTCSGVVKCFGGFHNRFSHLFLFLRGDLT